jgi:hypothetical protein
MTVLFFDGPKGALLAAADLGLPAYSAVRP